METKYPNFSLHPVTQAPELMLQRSISGGQDKGKEH